MKAWTHPIHLVKRNYEAHLMARPGWTWVKLGSHWTVFYSRDFVLGLTFWPCTICLKVWSGTKSCMYVANGTLLVQRAACILQMGCGWARLLHQWAENRLECCQIIMAQFQTSPNLDIPQPIPNRAMNTPAPSLDCGWVEFHPFLGFNHPRVIIRGVHWPANPCTDQAGLDSGSIFSPVGCDQAYVSGLIDKWSRLGPIYAWGPSPGNIFYMKGGWDWAWI